MASSEVLALTPTGRTAATRNWSTRLTTTMAAGLAVLCAVVLTGCIQIRDNSSDGARRPGTQPGDTWVRGVLIDPTHYEITDLRCTTRIAGLIVDSERVEATQYFARGTLTNLLDKQSPNYQLRFTHTYADGSTHQSTRLVLRMAAGESVEIEGFAGHEFSRPGPPVTCEVQVEDSVLNH